MSLFPLISLSFWSEGSTRFIRPTHGCVRFQSVVSRIIFRPQGVVGFSIPFGFQFLERDIREKPKGKNQQKDYQRERQKINTFRPSVHPRHNLSKRVWLRSKIEARGVFRRGIMLVGRKKEMKKMTEDHGPDVPTNIRLDVDKVGSLVTAKDRSLIAVTDHGLLDPSFS